MAASRIAHRYAKSLFDLARSEGQIESVHQDMMALGKAVRQNRDFDHALRSPLIPSDKKMSILEAIFGDTATAATMAFYRLVCRKGRERSLPEMPIAFTALYNAEMGITPATLTTAVRISPELEKEVSSLVSTGFGKGTVELESKVNPELLGGFVLRFEDKRYDASISSKLDELRVEFKKNSYIKRF